MPHSTAETANLAARTVGVSRIPVRNLWLLQLFASHLYRVSSTSLSSAEENPADLPDIVARLLADATEARLRQSLSTGFRRRTDVVNRVRGRIDLLDTHRHRRLERAQVSCRFDEVVVNTPGNQLVRAALARGTHIVSDPDLARRCRALDDRLRTLGVSDTAPQRLSARTLLHDRNLVRDREMIAAADFLLSLLIPAPGDPTHHARTVDEDDQFLRNLFEWAVYGFYSNRLTRHGWSIEHGHWLAFDYTNASPGLADVLPGMQLDIELRDPSGRHIILDTKFTAVTRRNAHDQQRLKSGYIYQIYAYVRSQEHLRDESLPPAEGLMLHPAVGSHLDEEMTVHGHRIRFVTVDLAGSSQTVTAQLVSAIAEAR